MTAGASSTLRAAVLAAEGYLDLELWYPVLRLREAGAEVVILGASADDTLRSVLGYPVIPDRSLADAGSGLGLVIVPGGQAARDLATDRVAVDLVAGLAADGAKVVTIGDGAAVATAAEVAPWASCDDADGLPGLFRTLLEAV